MIFKTKSKVKKSPKIGDVKVVEKYAWLPVRIDDETVIWLHKYKVKYEWSNSYFITEFDSGYEFRWEEVDRYILR